MKSAPAPSTAARGLPRRATAAPLGHSVLLAVAVAVAVLLGPRTPAAAAGGAAALDSYCAPSGTPCISVVGPGSDPTFILRSRNDATKYKLCFKQGRWDRQCAWWWPHRAGREGFVSRVGLRKSFFFEQPGGDCKVSAFLGDAEVQIGRALRFSWGRP